MEVILIEFLSFKKIVLKREIQQHRIIKLNTLGTILYAINGIIPFIFTLILFKRFNEKKKSFYLFWLTGFSAYGISSILNAYMYLNDPPFPVLSLLFTLFSLMAFICIVTGVGELVKRALDFFLVSLGVPILLLLFSALGRVSYSLDLLFMLPYLLITVGLVALQLMYNVNIGCVGLGWFLILIANIGYSTGNISFLAAPFISILGKSVIFYWMTRPRFSMITEEFEEFMKGSKSTTDQEAIVTLVETRKRHQELKWIREKIIDAGSRGTRSILFLTYDQLSDEIIKKSELNLQDLYIIEMTQEHQPIGAAFSERVLRISTNIDELNILLYDILDFIEANSVKSQILFFNVSTLINIAGWKRVYTFLISLIPRLKRSEIQSFFIYSPEIHKKQFEVEILRHLGDQVIDIRD